MKKKAPDSISEFNQAARELADKHTWSMSDPRRPFTPEYDDPPAEVPVADPEPVSEIGFVLTPQTISMIARATRRGEQARADSATYHLGLPDKPDQMALDLPKPPKKRETIDDMNANEQAVMAEHYRRRAGVE